MVRTDVADQFREDQGSATASPGADTAQCRFVRTAGGGLIDVSEISPDDRYARGPYSCLACGHVMVPALGRVRKHHFKHKAGRPLDCHNETYLHQLAKMALFKGLDAAIREGHPYWLTLERPVICSFYQDAFDLTCTGKSAPFEINLAAMFDEAEMEAGIDGFIADVLLSSRASGEHMLFELAVSHHCEEAKINSGLPIIEVEVQNEDAAGRLADGVDATSSSTSCYNLPVPEPTQLRCTTPCAATGLVTLVYDNEKVWYDTVLIGDETRILSDPHLVAHEIVDVSIGRRTWTWDEIEDHLKSFMIRYAFEEGISLTSCLLCWNNGGRVNEHDIYCKAKDRRVWMSSGAIGCPDYDPPTDAEIAEWLPDDWPNDRTSRT